MPAQEQTREQLLLELGNARRQIADLEALLGENHFREMADNIREVFWLFDWKKQQVVYASPAYEKIWGRSVEDLYGDYEDWIASVHPEDREYAAKSFAEILRTGGGEVNRALADLPAQDRSHGNTWRTRRPDKLDRQGG